MGLGGLDMSTKTLEFWFEFASTYSYVAAMRVERCCAEAGVDLAWRPFLLGPIFAAQGFTGSPFHKYRVKGAYMWRDMERLCAADGLPLIQSDAFPRGSLLATRIAATHETADWVGDFIRATYLANFGDDRDIGSADVVTELLEDVGQDPDAVIAASTTPEAKDNLKRQTQAAQDKGIFGAPSLTVGDELFWGNDRLEAAIAFALSKA